MKKLVTFVAVLLIIATAVAQVTSKQYVIEGKTSKTTHTPGDSVFLLDHYLDGNVISATTLSPDSTFTFSGEINVPFSAAVQIGDGSSTPFFVEHGNIIIHIGKPMPKGSLENGEKSHSYVGGTPLNNAMQKTGESLLPVMAKSLEIMALMFSDISDKEKEAKTNEIATYIEQESRRILFQSYGENKGNIFGAELLVELHRVKLITDDQLKQMVGEASATVTNYPKIKALLETLD